MQLEAYGPGLESSPEAGMALREVILTVLARRKMTGYEITRTFDQVLVYFWKASHQQVYRELASLHGDGCVVYEVVRQPDKPDKKVYDITAAGRDELRRWVAEETEAPRPQYDLLVKLLAGTLVDKRAITREIERVRTVSAGVLKGLRTIRRQCLSQPLDEMPDYDKTMYLALRRGLLLAQAQVAWLDEVKDFLEDGTLKR